MLLQLALRRKQTLLHVVRSPAQAQALRALGARHVVELLGDSPTPQLASLFAALGVSVVLDAHAGVHTDALLRALPRGGSVLVYGAGADADCTIDPGELICNNKSLEGFFLTDWMKKAGFARSVQAGLAVQRVLSEEPPTEVNARLPLDSYHQALDLLYRGRISDGQVQFQLVRNN
jgi:NADPH:quinone reductase-like Zn-dependent oxidoreductase